MVGTRFNFIPSFYFGLDALLLFDCILLLYLILTQITSMNKAHELMLPLYIILFILTLGFVYSDIIANRELLSFLVFIHATLYCKGKSTAMNLEEEILKELKKSSLLELLHQGCFLCGLSQNEEKIVLDLFKGVVGTQDHHIRIPLHINLM